MAVMIDKETKEAVPVTAFLNAEQLAKDLAAGQRRRRAASSCRSVGMALALMRNYDPFKAPTHFKLTDLMKKFDKTFGATGHDYGKVGADRTADDIEKRRADRWNFLFIAGMWFQDLFNYDFRRTERCIIPYATQEGEISFCAYNTGIGWRNIIEKMHMTATLTKWYEEHGRHEIFAGGKNVALASTDHSLVLDAEAVAAGKQTDLDDQGIAKNAREEKLRAKAEARKTADVENERMAALYRQHVLKEEPAGPVIQIQGLGGQEEGSGSGSAAQGTALKRSAPPLLTSTAARPARAAVFFSPTIRLMPRRFIRRALLPLVILTAAAAVPRAAGPAAVAIQIDAARVLGPMTSMWAFFGYDEPNYTYMTDGRALLSELAALSPMPVYVRAHNLLTSGDGTPGLKWGSTNAYTEDAAGRPVYDWTIVDRIFDTLIERKMKPIVEIGFMPEALSTTPVPYRHDWSPGADYSRIYTGWAYPPKDYDKWRELVFQLARHSVQRYGRREVESWYWEVWNEPDIGYWHGTAAEYLRSSTTTPPTG